MNLRSILLVASLFVGIQVAALLFLGQPLICECGDIKIWAGAVASSDTSQHITDWYTFSHVIHGVAFFALLSVLFPRLSIGKRFLIALAIEIGWEIVENTPMVIEHYRQQALALGYVGDSILNSLSDTLAMALGFVAAIRLPVWLIVALIVAFEAFTLYMVRDGLILSIIGLVHVFPAISAWQAGI